MPRAMSKRSSSVIWKNSSRGKVSEDVDERLAVVRVRIEAGAVEHALGLEAQHRDVAHAAAVGGGGEEAEEAILADEVALRRRSA